MHGGAFSVKDRIGFVLFTGIMDGAFYRVKIFLIMQIVSWEDTGYFNRTMIPSIQLGILKNFFQNVVRGC